VALLISINPLAQMEILRGFCTVLKEHSQNSRNILAMQINQIESNNARDAVLTSCILDQQHLEFGLSWFESNPGQHPQLSGVYPVSDGEIVYHPFSDVWSVH
jgi:hypothetical protein